MERLAALKPEDIALLKEKALLYFSRNGVPKKMEEALNAMFVDSPTDVYGYLVHFFKKNCAPPVIERISCKQTLSSNGELSNLLELHGKFAMTTQTYASATVVPFSALELQGDQVIEYSAIRNFVNDSLMASLSSNNDLVANFQNGDFDKYIYEHFRNREREAENEWRKEKLLAEQLAAPSESTATAPGKKEGKGKTGASKRPVQQIFELPPRPPGISVVSSLSKLLCLAASYYLQKQPYELIKTVFPPTLPIAKQKTNFSPLTVISQNGRVSSGKLRCAKEVFIMLSPSRSADTALVDVSKISDIFRNKAFATKGGGTTSRLYTEIGAVSPNMDRPEGLLDLLLESCTEAGLKPGVDVLFGINCAAHEIFDLDKGKYEVVVGAARTPEDAADFWSDLVTRYPIAILIDPLRKEDPIAWQKLGEKVGGKCFLFADRSLGDRLDHLAMGEITERAQSTLPDIAAPPVPVIVPDPMISKAQSRRPSTGGTAITVGTVVGAPPAVIPPCANGVILRMDGNNLMTLTAATKLAVHLNENNYLLMVAASPTDGADTFAVDLALGLGAHSLLVGGVGRAERSALFNKWHSYCTTNELEMPAAASIVPSERALLFGC